MKKFLLTAGFLALSTLTALQAEAAMFKAQALAAGVDEGFATAYIASHPKGAGFMAGLVSAWNTHEATTAFGPVFAAIGTNGTFNGIHAIIADVPALRAACVAAGRADPRTIATDHRALENLLDLIAPNFYHRLLQGAQGLRLSDTADSIDAGGLFAALTGAGVNYTANKAVVEAAIEGLVYDKDFTTRLVGKQARRLNVADADALHAAINVPSTEPVQAVLDAIALGVHTKDFSYLTATQKTILGDASVKEYMNNGHHVADMAIGPKSAKDAQQVAVNAAITALLTDPIELEGKGDVRDSFKDAPTMLAMIHAVGDAHTTVNSILKEALALEVPLGDAYRGEAAFKALHRGDQRDSGLAALAWKVMSEVVKDDGVTWVANFNWELANLLGGNLKDIYAKLDADHAKFSGDNFATLSAADASTVTAAAFDVFSTIFGWNE